MALLRQSLFSHHTTPHQDLINFHNYLLKEKREISIWGRIFKSLKFKKKQNGLEDMVQKEQTILQQDLVRRRLEWIDDPIFTSARQIDKNSIATKIDKIRHRFKVFEPEAKWLIFWNLLISLIILYYFFEIGLVIFLGQPVWQAQLQSPITYTLNILFILSLSADIFIQINTGYYHQGILFMDRLKVSQNYFKKYFVIDFGAIIIISTCFFTGSMNLNYIKVLFYLKVVNLNKIDATYQKMLIFHLKWNMIYLIFRQILILMISSHYFGVIFFAIDNYVYSTNYYGPSTPLLCWVYNAQAYSQIIWQPWHLWYIYSFYFAIGTMTTIAYGDITPLNPIDTIYVIFALIVVCIQFSYLLFNIIQIFSMGMSGQIQIDEQITNLNHYLKCNNIQSKLQVKIKSFIESGWNEQMYRDKQVQQQMISKIPNELKSQLLGEVYYDFIVQLMAFKYPQQFVNELVILIHEVRYSPGQYIVRKNEVIENIYYVVNGKVSFYLTDKLHMKQFNKVAVGIVQFYTQSLPQMSVVTVEDANVYCLGFQKFQSLIKRNQINYEIMKNITDQAKQQSRKNQLFHTYCFVCEESDHECFKCPNSHYIVNPQLINSIYNQFKQPRFTFERSINNRRFSKYPNRTRSIRKKQNTLVTLQMIEQMNLTQDLDLNDIDKFIQQTLDLLRTIQKGIIESEAAQIARQQSFQEMRNYQKYMRDFNLRNVLMKMNSQKESGVGGVR